MLAIVAPGQGSQTPGFLAPWLENSHASQFIDHWSSLIDLDLRYLGTLADADEIRETSNAQPLLVAAGLLSAAILFEGNYQSIRAFAGHSVGEITAIGIADVITFDEAMTLVRARGHHMSVSAQGTNTGMAAVLGGTRENVLAGLHALDLTAANENGAGQIVAAGTMTNIEALMANPPEGSRVRPLQVSGAFHTCVMEPAVEHLATIASGLDKRDSRSPVLSNKDGMALTNGAEIVNRIVGQIAGPVRWDLCMETLVSIGITGVIELAPAGTLVGLLKRAAPSIATFALKSPEDLAEAHNFISQHTASSEGK